MTDALSSSVVIVGAGSTGLVLAAELALAGVDVVVVERRTTQELAGHRARGLQARTIELLDQRGVAERFLTRGTRAQVTGFAQIPLTIADFPTRHPYGLALRQSETERLLAEWTAELGVPIHRGCDAVDLRQDATGVDVVLADGRTWRARYLVGCDGGRSAVRKRAGIDFVGWDASTSSIIAEVETTTEPPLGIRRDAKGVYAIGKLEDGAGVGLVLRDDEVRLHDPTLDEVRAALVALYGSDFGLRSARYLSRFTDTARQASTYRRGRVLVAGDAAHVHSPVGGQGLNLGMQDAANLGWKLAQVVLGISPESLLDTYHAERHPVGARVLQGTLAATALHRVDDRTAALGGMMAELLAMDGPRRHWAGVLSGLEIRYPLGDGHPLLGRRMPDLDLQTEGGALRTYACLREARPLLIDLGTLGRVALPPRVRRIDARHDGAWELPVIGPVDAPRAVLVRPDGYVAWVGDGTRVGLDDALTRWCGPARSDAGD